MSGTTTEIYHIADEWPCEECGQYTTSECGSCDEPVCADCFSSVHDCDEDEHQS